MRTHRPIRDTTALTVLELIVIIAVLAVLIGLLLSTMRRPGSGSSRSRCVNNLKCLGLAARIFATDNEEKFPWQVSTNKGGSQEYRDLANSAFLHFLTMSNELSAPKLLLCPEDKERIEAMHWFISNQNISYFLGLDAKKSAPQVLLSGDRNLMTNGVPVGSGLQELTTNLTLGWTSRMHNNAGNVLSGDGHVDAFSNKGLQAQLINSGIAAQRLVVR